MTHSPERIVERLERQFNLIKVYYRVVRGGVAAAGLQFKGTETPRNVLIKCLKRKISDQLPGRRLQRATPAIDVIGFLIFFEISFMSLFCDAVAFLQPGLQAGSVSPLSPA